MLRGLAKWELGRSHVTILDLGVLKVSNHVIILLLSLKCKITDCCLNHVIGGFQLKFVSISRVINHMTCYEFECSDWWKIYFKKSFTRFALQSEFQQLRALEFQLKTTIVKFAKTTSLQTPATFF